MRRITKTKRRRDRRWGKQDRANRALFEAARREATVMLGLMLAEERWPETYLLEKEDWRGGQRVAEHDHGALSTGKVGLRRTVKGVIGKGCGWSANCRRHSGRDLHGRRSGRQRKDRILSRGRRHSQTKISLAERLAQEQGWVCGGESG